MPRVSRHARRATGSSPAAAGPHERSDPPLRPGSARRQRARATRARFAPHGRMLLAILHIGFGCYPDAFAEAWQGREQMRWTGVRHVGVSVWMSPELCSSCLTDIAYTA
jgi:hypothetical protein